MLDSQPTANVDITITPDSQTDLGGAFPEHLAGRLDLHGRGELLDRLDRRRVRRHLRALPGLDHRLLDAGRSLEREEGKQLDKSVASLVRAMKKNKGRARLNVLTLLSRADSEVVRAKTRELLLLEKEPLARSEWSRAGVADPAARTAGPATRVARQLRGEEA